MKTILIKTAVVAVIFAVGYLIPGLLQFENKMQFTQTQDNYERLDCTLINNQCLVQGYKLELVKGTFSTMEQTTFQLTKDDNHIQSEVLITSDDEIFGTIISQRMANDPKLHKVLIPYCGNPVMQIIIIDSSTQKGLVINNLSQLS